MSRSDWRQVNGAAENHFLDDNVASEGKTSLKVKSRSTTPEIYEQSISDAPLGGRILLDARRSSEQGFTTYWRFQDVGSFYTVSLTNRHENHSHPRIILGYDGGRIDEEVIDPVFSDSERSDVNDGELKEGEFWHQRNDFIPYRVDFWVGDGDDVRAAVYEDADRDGDWTQLSSELVHEDPRYTEGGGIGVGGVPGNQAQETQYTNQGNYTYWIDDTEIYY